MKFDKKRGDFHQKLQTLLLVHIGTIYSLLYMKLKSPFITSTIMSWLMHKNNISARTPARLLNILPLRHYFKSHVSLNFGTLRCCDSKSYYSSCVTSVFCHWLYSLRSFPRGLFVCHKDCMIPVTLCLVLLLFDSITGLLVIENSQEGDMKIEIWRLLHGWQWGEWLLALLNGHNLGQTFLS
jgi:hypothetical protein